MEPLLGTPYFFLFLNLMLWGLLGFVTTRTIARRGERSAMQAVVKIVLDEPIGNLERFQIWVAGKDIISEDTTFELGSNNTKVLWQETTSTDWGGYAPKVELEFDS